MSRRFLSLAALAVATLGLAGCTILQPRPNRTQYYSLSAVSGTGRASEQPTETNLAVGLGPLKLPDYLKRTERAVRVGPNQFRFLEEERWVEPIDTSIVRVLSQDLTERFGSVYVVTLPSFQTVRRAYDVPVEILSFESMPNGDAELHARWGIKDAQTGEILLNTETHITEAAAGTDADASVAALSRTLDRWSDEIAAALRRVHAAPPVSNTESAPATLRKGGKELRR
jgi:uncharacterized protein